MVYEKLDKGSGAILFKKDHESRRMEDIYNELVALRKEVSKLKSEVKTLKSKIPE